jgi:stage II sporulation protein D
MGSKPILFNRGRWMSGILALAAMLSCVSASSAAPAKPAKPAAPKPLFATFNPYPPMVNPIRIGLGVRNPVVRFAVWSPGFVFVDAQPMFEIKPGMVYSIQNGAITELATGRKFIMPYDRRVHVTASDYRVWTGNVWYRGCLELINFGNKITTINLLDLEDYLLGVVPSEMPASWHLEALKSQAVAARSYAWAHIGKGSKWKSEGFDLVPDVRDQAYKGLAREAESTFHAVQQTRGLILKDSGRVKPGFYRATVGDNAFSNLNIRKHTVNSAMLEKITGVPDIVGVTVKQWDANGNAHNIVVMGAKKSREVYGVALATMIGLTTAGILDCHEEGPNWVFTCRGPGNGALGLSQHGANMLAQRGWRFDQILQQYYQDTDGQLRLDYVNNYRSAAATPPPSATD